MSVSPCTKDTERLEPMLVAYLSLMTRNMFMRSLFQRTAILADTLKRIRVRPQHIAAYTRHRMPLICQEARVHMRLMTCPAPGPGRYCSPRNWMPFTSISTRFNACR
jgi:hypothetical protein